MNNIIINNFCKRYYISTCFLLFFIVFGLSCEVPLICKDINKNIISDKEIVNLNKVTPLLAITIMVKNEEDVIEKTLEPFVINGIDSFLVFDTGSTDKTVEVVEKFFDKYKIKNGHIIQESFIDFSTSRNRAIDLTKEKFPNVGFIFMIDAEWYVENIGELISFCKKNIYKSGLEKYDVYFINLFYGNNNVLLMDRLIRADSNIRFLGSVHEYILTRSKKIITSNTYINYNPSKRGLNKSRDRFKNDVKLLLRDHAKDPEDSRTIFYLAQTYSCMNELAKAAYYYDLRSKVKSEDKEETYIAFYRLGMILESMMLNNIPKLNNSEKVKWLEVLDVYHRAHNLRPHRAEPLVRIADYYRSQKDYSLGYIYAQRAIQLSFPENDILFVEKDLYDFARWDIISVCAWNIGEYQVGESALLQALKSRPNSERLKKNLDCYIRKERIN